jgi:hypothetical protein
MIRQCGDVCHLRDCGTLADWLSLIYLLFDPLTQRSWQTFLIQSARAMIFGWLVSQQIRP